MPTYNAEFLLSSPLPPASSAGSGYYMRGRDTSLNLIVFWTATSLDAAGAQYAGPGPLTDVVLMREFAAAVVQGVATPAANGLMAAADKAKLDAFGGNVLIERRVLAVDSAALGVSIAIPLAYQTSAKRFFGTAILLSNNASDSSIYPNGSSAFCTFGTLQSGGNVGTASGGLRTINALPSARFSIEWSLSNTNFLGEKSFYSRGKAFSSGAFPSMNQHLQTVGNYDYGVNPAPFTSIDFVLNSQGLPVLAGSIIEVWAEL